MPDSGAPRPRMEKSVFMRDFPEGLAPGVKTTPTQPAPPPVVPPSPTSRSPSSPSSTGESFMEDAPAGVSPGLPDPDVYADAFCSIHISELAVQVSGVLASIVSRNDKTPFNASNLTRFHSRAPPGISIRDYILRIIKFCNLDHAVLLVMLYFADLLSQKYESFVLNTLTVHRFLITAATVGSKGLCDQFCSNTHYAKVGGISVMELNLLEVEFLTRVSYKIVPPYESLPHYYAQIKAMPKVLPRHAPPRAAVPADPTLAGHHKAESISSQTASTSSVFSRQRTGSWPRLARKHSRDSIPPQQNGGEAEHQPPVPEKPAIAATNKGLKAMRGTLKFLQPSKKKKET